MSTINKYLVAKKSGRLQIPYQDYVVLMGKVKEGERMRLVKEGVLVSLQNFLEGKCPTVDVSERIAEAGPGFKPESAIAEKVTVEFEEELPVPVQPAVNVPVQPVKKTPVSKVRGNAESIQVPPIKKDISDHFNSTDESGRLFNVFKQYYACLNDSCGGTVRVTMKDGFCSLWNYDEWEEFAFTDIFEGQLRIALDPRYTETLQSLDLCEVPRLLSSRRNLVCVQVDDLNNTMLDVLVKAFEEVGLTAS